MKVTASSPPAVEIERLGRGKNIPFHLLTVFDLKVFFKGLILWIIFTANNKERVF